MNPRCGHITCKYQKVFENLFEKTSCVVSGLKGEAEGYITVSNSQKGMNLPPFMKPEMT
jgi:hypothetical protein